MVAPHPERPALAAAEAHRRGNGVALAALAEVPLLAWRVARRRHHARDSVVDGWERGERGGTGRGGAAVLRRFEFLLLFSFSGDYTRLDFASISEASVKAKLKSRMGGSAFLSELRLKMSEARQTSETVLRADVAGSISISPLPAGCSELKLAASTVLPDADGMSTSAVVSDAAAAVLSYLLSAVPRLHHRHRRYEEVDAAELERYEEEVIKRPPKLIRKEIG